MATSTTLRRKEQVKPVTGKVRWLRPLVFGKTLGRIAITNANNETIEYDIGVSMGASKPATSGRFKTSQGLIVQSTCFSSLGEHVRVNL